LGQSANLWGTHQSRSRGFSMVELAVSLCIMMVLTGIALPSFMRSFRTYQLNDSATRVSDVLKFTRFEAVRRNRPANFQMKQSGNDWQVWADSDNDGVLDSTEKQILITGFVTLLPAGGSPGPPDPGSITATLGGSPGLTTISGANGIVTFDARGAVSPFAADVLYLGNNTYPEYGYRAVILLPSGATQIWSAPAAGPWRRMG
jgi:type II secretory pathway pseudopilin PulG